MKKTTEERREAIAVWLMAEDNPVSGDMIAERFGVSRQTVVKDIGALREQGYDVGATHTGYVLRRSPLAERVFKVRHESDSTMDELTTIVTLGGTVVDVHVWHKVYGKLSAPLNIYTHEQIAEFMQGVRDGRSTELMAITGGYHYHTVRAKSEDVLDRIAAVLEKKGYTVPEME